MVNNYSFANQLDQFRVRVLEPQEKRVLDAFSIITDLNYKWKDEDQKSLAQKKYDNYLAWLDFYRKFYAEALLLCTQHEQLTDTLSKWYDIWYKNISNDGKQETEMMEVQADMLNEIFVEMYKLLQPLNLDIKPPKPLNL